MNVLILTGNFGQDPEIRYFESGNTLAEFSLAVNSRKGGEKITDWYNCKAWGKAAEVIADYCRKGSKVALTGQLKKETWQDKETGRDRFKYVPTFNQVELLSSKKDDGPQQQSRPPAPEAKPVAAGGVDYDEIPFNRFGDELNWGA